MSYLVACPVCSKSISSEAKSCPHCGESQHKYTKQVHAGHGPMKDHRCSGCGGTGTKTHRWGSQTCSVCNGTGTVSYRDCLSAIEDSRRRV